MLHAHVPRLYRRRARTGSMNAPSALRGAGGCSSFSDRASALSAGDTRAGLAQLARGPAEAATTARRTYREGRGANLALSRSRPLRNHVDTHSTQFVFTTRQCHTVGFRERFRVRGTDARVRAPTESRGSYRLTVPAFRAADRRRSGIHTRVERREPMRDPRCQPWR